MAQELSAALQAKADVEQDTKALEDLPRVKMLEDEAHVLRRRWVLGVGDCGWRWAYIMQAVFSRENVCMMVQFLN